MTPEQIKDKQRIERLIREKTTGSLMNNTKWKKLFRGFLDGKVPSVMVSTKYLTSEKPLGPAHLSWSEMMQEQLNLIEWMELHHETSTYVGEVAGRKITNHRAALLAHLQEIHVGFTEYDQRFRITGHLRATEPPPPHHQPPIVQVIL